MNIRVEDLPRLLAGQIGSNALLYTSNSGVPYSISIVDIMSLVSGATGAGVNFGQLTATSGALNNQTNATGSVLDTKINVLSGAATTNVVFTTGNQLVNGTKQFGSSLQDTNSIITANFNTRTLFDGGAHGVISWGNYRMTNLSGNLVLDWSGLNLVDGLNVNALNWLSRVLYDSSGNTSVDWQNRILSGNWNSNNFNLNGSPVATAINLQSTGQTLLNLINASSAGVSSLNAKSGALSLTGAGGTVVSVNGQTITVSGGGSSASVANVVYTSGNQLITGTKTFVTAIDTPSITDVTSPNSINMNAGTITDGNSLTSLDWNNRLLVDNSTVTSIDWNNRNLNGSWSVNSIGIANVSNLQTTGQNLFKLITGVSGNLQQTGSNLQGQVNTLTTNLQSTGQTLFNLINASSAGVSSLNSKSGILNLTGAGSNTVTVNGQTITISGSAGTANVTNVVYTTGIQTISGAKSFVTNVGAPSVTDLSSPHSISLNTALIIDGSSVNSIDWDNRLLLDSSASTSVDWQNRNLNGSWTVNSVGIANTNQIPVNIVFTTGNQTISGIKVFASTIQDTSARNSINLNTRTLFNSNANGVLAWDSCRITNPFGTLVIDWSGLNLYDTGAAVAINWQNRILSGNWNSNNLNLSGNLVATAINLQSTGQALFNLINASSAGVSSLNGKSGILTITGAGAASVSVNGQTITVSGSTNASNLTNVVFTTGVQTIMGSKTFTDNTIFNSNLGSPTGFWSITSNGLASFAGGIYDPVNSVVGIVCNDDHILYNLFGSGVLDFNDSQLIDNAGQISLDWGNRIMSKSWTATDIEISGAPLTVEGVRVVKSQKIDFTKTGSYSIYTVPTNYLFSIDTMEVITTDITSPSAAPFVEFGNSSNLSAYQSLNQTISNTQFARHVYDNPQDAVNSGIILTTTIATASTALMHSGFLLFKGYLMRNT